MTGTGKGIVVVGLQWGDEGKGKVTDLVGSQADYVVRYNGGDNAGHTVILDGETYALHSLPSGILNSRVTSVIGNGAVVDPQELTGELRALRERGVHLGRLVISPLAHVTAPFHRLLDGVRETALRNGRIGTTGRGIGPTYVDKARRNGIRVQDLLDGPRLRVKVEANLRLTNRVLEQVYSRSSVDAEGMVDALLRCGEELRPFVDDAARLLNRALDDSATVLFEGGQATMLDVDHGTYPFVSSSNATAGGACTGSGVGPTRITRVIGVAKAYVTRVGSGPFPTEMTGKPGADGEKGDWLRHHGHEFGVTTGRPRRTGWFDAVVSRYAAMVNGCSDMALTKLDVLTGLPSIPVCVAYDVRTREGWKRTRDLPVNSEEFASAKPVYDELPGWSEPIDGIANFTKLPVAARAYVENVEKLSDCAVSLIGTGAGRESIIKRHMA